MGTTRYLIKHAGDSEFSDVTPPPRAHAMAFIPLLTNSIGIDFKG